MAINDEQWQEMSNQFQQAFKDLESLQEAYWESLTKEQQLDVFCSVVRRLCKGELDEKRSYRGILYDTFEWGPEAYATAQMAGFLELHNAIWRQEEVREIINEVLTQLDIEPDPDIIKEVFSKHGLWA